MPASNLFRTIIHSLLGVLAVQSYAAPPETDGKPSLPVYAAYRGARLELPGGPDGFATRVVSALSPTPARDGGEPRFTLGPPDTLTDNDRGNYSLGCRGELVLAFDNLPIAEGPGPDLYIVEVGEAPESMDLFLSANGDDWLPAGKSRGGVEGVDISPFVAKEETFQFLKLRDRGDRCYGTRAGADLDAVAVIPRTPPEPPGVAESGMIPAASTESRPPEAGKLMTLGGEVLFDSGKSELSAKGKEKLLELAGSLVGVKEPVTVTGHSDSIGSDGYNMALSRKRAASVADFLREAAGLPPEGVVAEGMGKSKPVADNGTVEGRAKNRRVEIVLGRLNP